MLIEIAQIVFITFILVVNNLMFYFNNLVVININDLCIDVPK